MPDAEKYPLLRFSEPFNDFAWQYSAKGYYRGLIVEVEDGSCYSVFFYEPVRLSQDLQAEVEAGRPYLAEQGMIVIPEISEDNIRTAIRRLYKEGWFKHLHPLPATIR